jgi:hypothetical protein
MVLQAIFLYALGPGMAAFFTPNLHEQASIWCLFSMAQVHQPRSPAQCLFTRCLIRTDHLFSLSTLRSLLCFSSYTVHSTRIGQAPRAKLALLSLLAKAKRASLTAAKCQGYGLAPQGQLLSSSWLRLAHCFILHHFARNKHERMHFIYCAHRTPRLTVAEPKTSLPAA